MKDNSYIKELDFFDTVEVVNIIAEKIEMSETTDTVKTIVEELERNRDLILEVSKAFKFKDNLYLKAQRDRESQETQSTKSTHLEPKVYTIAMTGSIRKITVDGKPIGNRDNLKPFLESRYPVIINISKTKTSNNKKFDYLIMDTDMTSNNKYNSMTSSGNIDKVITSKKFIEIIEQDLGISKDSNYKNDTEDEILNLTTTDNNLHWR